MKYLSLFLVIPSVVYATEVNNFDASVYKPCNMNELYCKNYNLACSVMVFREDYKAHMWHVRNELSKNSELADYLNFRYTKSVYGILPNEIAKCLFNINEYKNNNTDMLTCVGNVENYTISNFVYYILINFLNQAINGNKAIDEKLVDSVVTELNKKHEKKYSDKLKSASYSLKQYCNQLHLYDYLLCLRNAKKQSNSVDNFRIELLDYISSHNKSKNCLDIKVRYNKNIELSIEYNSEDRDISYCGKDSCSYDKARPQECDISLWQEIYNSLIVDCIYKNRNVSYPLFFKFTEIEGAVKPSKLIQNILFIDINDVRWMHETAGYYSDESYICSDDKLSLEYDQFYDKFKNSTKQIIDTILQEMGQDYKSMRINDKLRCIQNNKSLAIRILCSKELVEYFSFICKISGFKEKSLSDDEKKLLNMLAVIYLLNGSDKKYFHPNKDSFTFTYSPETCINQFVKYYDSEKCVYKADDFDVTEDPNDTNTIQHLVAYYSSALIGILQSADKFCFGKSLRSNLYRELSEEDKITVKFLCKELQEKIEICRALNYIYYTDKTNKDNAYAEILIAILGHKAYNYSKVVAFSQKRVNKVVY